MNVFAQVFVYFFHRRREFSAFAQPLIARSTVNNTGDENNAPGLKVVVMKRFSDDWGLFIDVDGGGFVRVDGSRSDHPSASSKEFPSPEWIASNVQNHVEGLSQ